MNTTSQFPQHITIPTKSPNSITKVSALRQDLTHQTHQLINNQVQKIRKSNTQITTILSNIQNNRVKCQQTINNLNRQIAELDTKVNDYKLKNNTTQEQEQIRSQIRSFQGEHINICKERVRLANQINIKSLQKINIQDKKSPANQIFRWVLSVIYNEPDNKYFWPNFKEQALKNDKGRDFVQRLGKVSGMNVKQQHKVRTQQFLANYNTYASAPQLQKARPELDKINQIAKCFKRTYMISGFIKEHQDKITKHKQSTLEKDQQFMRWKARSQALKQRIDTNQSYLRVLNETATRLAPKQQIYAQKLQQGESLLRDFQGMEKYVVSDATNKLMEEQHGQCEKCQSCSLF